jgi:predicted amidohydrolase
MADLILKGGRVLDPGKGLDVVADVAFSAGKDHRHPAVHPPERKRRFDVVSSQQDRGAGMIDLTRTFIGAERRWGSRNRVSRRAK